MRISDWSSDVCSSDLRETEKRAASASSSSTSPGASSPARISFSIAARTELECVSFAKKIDQSIRKLLTLNRAKSFHGQVNAVPLHAPKFRPAPPPPPPLRFRPFTIRTYKFPNRTPSPPPLPTRSPPTHP